HSRGAELPVVTLVFDLMGFDRHPVWRSHHGRLLVFLAVKNGNGIKIRRNVAVLTLDANLLLLVFIKEHEFRIFQLLLIVGKHLGSGRGYMVNLAPVIELGVVHFVGTIRWLWSSGAWP